MPLLFALSRIVTLLGCGWSMPCAIASVAGDLPEWVRGFRAARIT